MLALRVISYLYLNSGIVVSRGETEFTFTRDLDLLSGRKHSTENLNEGAHSLLLNTKLKVKKLKVLIYLLTNQKTKSSKIKSSDIYLLTNTKVKKLKVAKLKVLIYIFLQIQKLKN